MELGFLGSNLCKKLVEEGNYVICLDNLLTGKIKNIETLLTKDNFEFIEADIIDSIDLKIDQIYNAACPASPLVYQKSPINTIKTCVLGTINLLELATRNNATFLQFSTSEVYGNPLVHPQLESYNGNVNPIGVRACYDEGKRIAETLCFDYNRELGTKIKVIRIFNTYGPNMREDDGRAIPNFIMQALNNEDITIYGDGKQTRSFCFVFDLIEAIIKVMNSEEQFLGPINLGNPKECTILELANKIIELTSSSSKLTFKTLPKDDPIQRRPDISLVRKMFNWEPTINLESGLKETIAYLKKEEETIK